MSDTDRPGLDTEVDAPVRIPNDDAEPAAADAPVSELVVLADSHSGLTARQRAILEFIHSSLEERGYPPSVREICEGVGLKSTSSVHAQLQSLEAKGFLRKETARPRALGFTRDLETGLELAPEQTRNVPLVGEIAAGNPILAEERVDAVYPLPRQLVGDGTLFMLKVRGESMIDAGVFDGDLVVVREQPTVEQGEMCAALVDGEATVKFFRRTKGGDVFLDPANEAFEPIPVDRLSDTRIMGKVVTVMRAIR